MMTIDDRGPGKRVEGAGLDGCRPDDPQTWVDHSVRDAAWAAGFFMLVLAFAGLWKGCGHG